MIPSIQFLVLVLLTICLSQLLVETMNRVRGYIITSLHVAVLMGIVLNFILTLRMPTDIPRDKGITSLWLKQPIVSVYLPSHNQSNHCAHGYEAVPINNTITSISGGPCGCVRNNSSFQSTIQSCTPLHAADVCTSLPNLHPVNSELWRKSTICVKRAGQATMKRGWFDKIEHTLRPHAHDHCPVGYKKCGDEIGHQADRTICFPSNSDCPITNLMILPDTQTPPVNEKWEVAGTFLENNHNLYIRRDYQNKLPIIDLVMKLAEYSNIGENKRGICYEGPDQAVFSPIVADSSMLWSYNITLPRVCEIADARYELVDQMPLQDHFLQHLQLSEPACAGFSLYSLSDPRYLPALDPDYLNSGVKCGSDSHYPCLRDPYQRTDCATGDDICDGVMNQNICGAYVHAVRSALRASAHVTMGVYIARESGWTANCSTTQDAALAAPGWLFVHILTHAFSFAIWCVQIVEPLGGNIRYMFDYIGCMITLLVVGLDIYSIGKVSAFQIRFLLHIKLLS